MTITEYTYVYGADVSPTEIKTYLTEEKKRYIQHAFLMGLENKAENQNSVKRAFDSPFGELNVMRLIFGFCGEELSGFIPPDEGDEWDIDSNIRDWLDNFFGKYWDIPAEQHLRKHIKQGIVSYNREFDLYETKLINFPYKPPVHYVFEKLSKKIKTARIGNELLPLQEEDYEKLKELGFRYSGGGEAGKLKSYPGVLEGEYKSFPLSEFFVMNIPHDQLDDAGLNDWELVIGLKVGTLPLTSGLVVDEPNFLQGDVYRQAYAELLKKLEGSTLYEKMSKPVLMRVQDDCGCCS